MNKSGIQGLNSDPGCNYGCSNPNRFRKTKNHTKPNIIQNRILLNVFGRCFVKTAWIISSFGLIYSKLNQIKLHTYFHFFL